MLEQQKAVEEQQNQYAPTANSGHSVTPALPPHAQALIAGYVAQAEVEQQSATRQRLDELTAAHLELDADPEQAARSAIQQIESERKAMEQQQAAAKQQAVGQRKRTRAAKQSARPATLTALKLFGAGALAMVSIMVVLLVLISHTHGDTMFSLMIWLLQFVCFGLPALLGVAVGARAKHRSAMGTFCAIAMLTMPVSLMAALVMNPFMNWTSTLLQLVFLMGFFWIPIGTASAALTGWGRDTLRRKRRRAQESSTA